jgi:Flp pilus assembly protein TadG
MLHVGRLPVTKRTVAGQSLVEFALVVPFIILIILGIVEGAFYIHTRSTVERAVQRAAEWANVSPPSTVSPNDDDSTDLCATLIKQAALHGTTLQTLKAKDITITYPDPTRQQREVGNPVQVQITYTTDWLTPLGRQFFGEKLEIDVASRRTIVNIGAPAGMAEDCKPG